jgi:hypothetical protein
LCCATMYFGYAYFLLLDIVLSMFSRIRAHVNNCALHKVGLRCVASQHSAVQPSASMEYMWYTPSMRNTMQDVNKQCNILYSLEDGPWRPKHVVIQWSNNTNKKKYFSCHCWYIILEIFTMTIYLLRSLHGVTNRKEQKQQK